MKTKKQFAKILLLVSLFFLTPFINNATSQRSGEFIFRCDCSYMSLMGGYPQNCHHCGKSTGGQVIVCPNGYLFCEECQLFFNEDIGHAH